MSKKLSDIKEYENVRELLYKITDYKYQDTIDDEIYVDECFSKGSEVLPLCNDKGNYITKAKTIDDIDLIVLLNSQYKELFIKICEKYKLREVCLISGDHHAYYLNSSDKDFLAEIEKLMIIGLLGYELYGEVEFEGKKFTLTESPWVVGYYSERLKPEQYEDEMTYVAHAVGEDWLEYRISWKTTSEWNEKYRYPRAQEARAKERNTDDEGDYDSDKDYFACDWDHPASVTKTQ